jgi:phage shock protein A
MFTGIILIVIAFGVLGATIGYSNMYNSKLAFRLRGLFNRSKDSAADRLGTIVDDRQQKIVERKEVNAKFREQMGAIKADILIHTKQHERALQEAEKYAALAMAAVKQGNDSAAREALMLKKQKETLASTLLTTVETCEATFDELNRKYSESSEEVRLAESNQASFKAEFGSLALRRKMQESTQAFGGIGNLDFTSSDSELEKMRAEVQAFDEIDEGTDVLKKLEKQVAINSVEQELQAMKKKKSVRPGQKLKYNGHTYTVGSNTNRAYNSSGGYIDLTDYILLDLILSHDNYCDVSHVEAPAIEYEQTPVFDGARSHYDDVGSVSESYSYDSGSSDSGGCDSGGCGGD